MRNAGIIIVLILIGIVVPVMAACAAPAQPPVRQDDFTTIIIDNATSVTLTISPLPVKPDRVELVYLYPRDLCPCMAAVKDNLAYSVETNFAREIAAGRLKLITAVSDDPANTELIKQYDATLFGLFIKEIRGSEEKVYQLSDFLNMTGADNREKLINYIRNKISRVLEGQDS